ncbi:MAG: ABC transporter permease [Acetobacter sp.]
MNTLLFRQGGMQVIVPRPQGRSGLPRPVRRLLGPVLLLAVWEGAALAGWVSPDTLPAPHSLFATCRELAAGGELAHALEASLARVSIGVVTGLACGVGLGLLSSLTALGEDLIDGVVHMARTLPWVGLIPLLIIWLGIEEASKDALIALAVFFPVYINLVSGVRQVDPGLIEAGRTLGLSRLGVVRHVLLPGAMPNLLTGLRYALGSAWLALVFAEQVNSLNGLGYLINHAREIYRTDIIVVCLFIYAFLGLAADFSIRFLESRLLAWNGAFATS